MILWASQPCELFFLEEVYMEFTHAHTHTQTHVHVSEYTLTHTHTHTLTCTHTHTHSHAHTHTHSHAHTHTHKLKLRPNGQTPQNICMFLPLTVSCHWAHNEYRYDLADIKHTMKAHCTNLRSPTQNNLKVHNNSTTIYHCWGMWHSMRSLP